METVQALAHATWHLRQQEPDARISAWSCHITKCLLLHIHTLYLSTPVAQVVPSPNSLLDFLFGRV